MGALASLGNRTRIAWYICAIADISNRQIVSKEPDSLREPVNLFQHRDSVFTEEEEEEGEKVVRVI